MYNKIVVTLLMFAMIAGTAHAQYYTSYYAPVSYGYANSQYAGPSSAAGFSYFGQRIGPVLGPPAPRTPSNLAFAYSGINFAPTYAGGGGIGPVSFGVQPMVVSPTYGGGGIGSVNLNLQAVHVTPTYGSGPSFGNMQFSLAPREIPYGTGLGFGSVRYDMRNNLYAVPIYATPSRVLFNSEFGFGSYNPYQYYW